ncbi:MAG: hypothetical protein RL708_767 [Bacteroidota bacterium]|jgi:hypothetical protein
MQKYILTAAFIVASFGLANSQNVSTANKFDIKLHPEKPELTTQNKFSAACFQIADVVYTVIENAKPNTVLEFYSTIHGGKLVANCTTDKLGFAQKVFSAKAVPGFAINKPSADSREGFVEHFIEKEFVLEKFEAQRNGNTISLNWNANSSAKNTITFEILKSTDGKNYSVINTQQANSSEGLSTYTFTENFNESSSYKLRIIKNNSIARYTSEPLNADANKSFKVYPTVSSTNIHIDASDNTIEPTPFYIINVSGEILKNGLLDKAQNEVAINEFVAGIYFVQIGTKTQKFIKE